MLNNLLNNPFYLISSLIIIGLLIWQTLLQLKLSQLKKKLKTLFNGSKATDLEGVLFEAIKRQKSAEKQIEEINLATKKLNQMAQSSVQKIGVVRYNPFKDTGGDQSFVVALLDANDNGLTIASLYSREGTRVYSKPIKQGESKYPLTQEEKEAIQQAQSPKPNNKSA